ncbi:MAG: group 1 truncated hemoglobin [Bryobacteraceae bacterium]
MAHDIAPFRDQHHQDPDSPTELSLYERLGGYDGIARVIDDLFALLRADPRFSRFGTGRSIDSRKRVQQMTVEQICALSGGPCYYIGRDMKTSHAGLGITEFEWDANIELTRIALQKNHIGIREKEEFVSLFELYKAEIIEGPHNDSPSTPSS